MSKNEQFCYVYIQMPGTFETVPCASLRIKTVGANAHEGTFTYGKKYLQRKNVVSLDDFHLPLSQQPLKFTKLKGIPGALRDASPDAWGRRVIQARLEKAEADIQEIDYLLNGPDDGAGNLSFGLSPEPPPPRRPFNKTHQLEALIDATEKLEEGSWLPHEILENLEPGTSMGGARPKATIEDQNILWLAKFPEKNDQHNLQLIEYATLELARAAGLNVCGTRLEKVGRRDVLMLRRFDREWISDERRYLKHGLVSGLTVIDAEDGYMGRERWSYLLLADELKRWSSKNREDRSELFRRMVFNAMVTNNDDHPRNHALLRTSGGWRLSPAYDIVPTAMISQERRELALTAGQFGRTASIYNLLSRADIFGLSPEEARGIMSSMLHIVEGWKELFAKHGVKHRTITMLEQAILPQCYFRTEPIDIV